MNICVPKINKQQIGGGFTFLNNFKKAVSSEVLIVDTIDQCDILFIAGVTLVDKSFVYEANRQGKPVVFRIDNVPRKSRNSRSTPHERMKEYASMSDVIVYQSEWAKRYCSPIIDDGIIIRNGVDTNIFYKPEQEPKKDIYFYAYHGSNELKSFWRAHYYFQMIHRENPDAEFWFTYDFGKQYTELQNADFDFWNGEKYTYFDKIQTPEEMANIMRQCKYLIYPSFSDASPNIALEARACGLEVLYAEKESGTPEIIKMPYEDLSLERMGQEYISLFKLLTSI